jgi:hypothetical protein
MSSGDLIPNEGDPTEPTSSEVQFALVIARMIETVNNSPEHMRQAVYDLARYKLREQFTHSDVRNVGRAEKALEVAIRGVEEFSKQQIGIPAPPPVPQLHAGLPQFLSAVSHEPRTGPVVHDLEIKPTAVTVQRHPLWSVVLRTALVLLIVGAVATVVQQREHLTSLGRYLEHLGRQTASGPPAAPAPVVTNSAPKAVAAPKPAPLRPTDYGVYAIGDDALTELPLLPGRPPDIRVAVSAAFKLPSQASLRNAQPKFIVFRRDVATNILERAEVRVIAKIAREFSAEAVGKRPDEADDSWVIRNFSYPFRASPVPDNSEMYELHGEDPALELPPGRYALVLKSQAYYFRVEGEVVDPRQCIERVVATNGTFYTACKRP